MTDAVLIFTFSPVQSFIAEAPVSGERRVISIDGRANIADGRAQVGLDARTLAVQGGAGGEDGYQQLGDRRSGCYPT